MIGNRPATKGETRFDILKRLGDEEPPLSRSSDEASTLRRCWDCGYEIGAKSVTCSHCNASQTLPMRAVQAVAVLFGIVAVAAVATIIFGDKDPAANAFQAPHASDNHVSPTR